MTGNENSFEPALNVLDEVNEGDQVTVRYRNVQGTISERSGEVTNVRTPPNSFAVDTGDEQPDGTPIGFDVTRSGGSAEVRAWGTNQRRLTDLYNSETEIRIDERGDA